MKDPKYEELEKKLASFEEKITNKLDKLYKYRIVQLTLKVLILSSISALFIVGASPV